MGLEIVEQIPDLRCGHCSGRRRGFTRRRFIGREDSATGSRKSSPSKPKTSRVFQLRLTQENRRRLTMRPTLADGLAIPQVGENAFQIARPLIDLTVTVTEEQIALAILRLVELEKSVVEGAAATPLAACISGKLTELAGKRVVLLLCGGNIDPNVLSRVIERGLVADGGLGDSPP